MSKRIDFSKSFEKAYARRIARNEKLKKAYTKRYCLFAQGERGYPIHDHALTDSLAGKRAFSIGGDLRVIYIELSSAIIFVDIGSHSQVYK
jgi:addiction module RelE/StbE family toxin